MGVVSAPARLPDASAGQIALIALSLLVGCDRWGVEDGVAARWSISLTRPAGDGPNQFAVATPNGDLALTAAGGEFGDMTLGSPFVALLQSDDGAITELREVDDGYSDLAAQSEGQLGVMHGGYMAHFDVPSLEMRWEHALDRAYLVTHLSRVASAPDGSLIALETASSGEDYLSAWSPEGEVLWYQEILPDRSGGVSDLEITDDGDIVLLGSGSDSTLGAGDGPFVVKLAAEDLSVRWATRFAGYPSRDLSARPWYLAAGGDRIFVTAASTTGDPLAPGPEEREPDIYVLALADSGEPLWSTVIGDSGHEALAGMAVLSGGDVVVGGRFFDGDTRVGDQIIEDCDAFVARLSARDGSVVGVQTHCWSGRVVGASPDGYYRIGEPGDRGSRVAEYPAP